MNRFTYKWVFSINPRMIYRVLASQWKWPVMLLLVKSKGVVEINNRLNIHKKCSRWFNYCDNGLKIPVCPSPLLSCALLGLAQVKCECGLGCSLLNQISKSALWRRRACSCMNSQQLAGVGEWKFNGGEKQMTGGRGLSWERPEEAAGHVLRTHLAHSPNGHDSCSEWEACPSPHTYSIVGLDHVTGSPMANVCLRMQHWFVCRCISSFHPKQCEQERGIAGININEDMLVAKILG